MRYFFLLVLLALPATAEDKDVRVTCDETKCVVLKADLAELLRANQGWSERAERAESQLRELRSHICAGKWM